jgi:hypothetical protein
MGITFTGSSLFMSPTQTTTLKTIITMKKDLFNRIIEALKEMLPVYTTTVRESFTCVSFLYNDDKGGIQQLKELLADKSKTHEQHHKDLAYTMHNTTKTYIRVAYDFLKDKISVGTFETGYRWASRKKKYYPVGRNTPIYCYSKHLYHFQNRGISKGKPRIMWSTTITHYNEPLKKIGQLMLNINYEPSAMILARYCMNTKDEWEAIYNKTGVRIPKALRIFNKSEICELVSVLRNPNELSSLCMFISKGDKEKVLTEEDDDPRDFDFYGMSTRAENRLMSVLSVMMFGEKQEWLVRDWIQDLVKLKRKTTLRITSKKRIEEEHRRMSREVALMGIRSIKVHDEYIEMFKSFPIEGSELIMDKKRLLHEGLSQDHCVAGYGPQINNGSCCIISVPYEGKQWTLQVGKRMDHDKSTYYYPVQFRGLRNKPAPRELDLMVEGYFSSTRTPVIQHPNGMEEPLLY